MDATKPAPIHVSEDEAAAIVRVSKGTLYNERKAGRLPFVKIRRRVMYRLEALDAWSKANEQSAVAG